ncbi:MAG: hypothetical protein CMJ94_07440 [Planctomycetes bacterium]|nr:hypothetical protein [Planctomycetota bacterium]
MLAVHAPLPAASLLEGIERCERFRASTHGTLIPKLPDAEALQAVLYAAFAEEGFRPMTRGEILERALARGVGEASANQ